MRLLRARPFLVDGVLAACLGAFAQWMVWSGSVAGPRVAVAALYVLVGFPLIIRRRARQTVHHQLRRRCSPTSLCS